MSNTKNVKLGVCQVFFNGFDLGYTKGGVEVSVKSETHKVMIDQFGKTPINEYVMGREVSAKVPMAETTIENMVATMPGSTLSQAGGGVATGTITFSAVPANNDTLTINGVVFTYKTSPVAGVETDMPIPASAAAGAIALAALLTNSTNPKIAEATYTSAALVVTVKYGNPMIYGTTGKMTVDGNAFTLAKTGSATAVSGATLTGGVEPTSLSVMVGTGVGTDLLSISKELRLHPVGKAITDKTDDFVVLKAATSGGLTFGYKLEDERVYNVDFTGYPNTSGNLFSVGV